MLFASEEMTIELALRVGTLPAVFMAILVAGAGASEYRRGVRSLVTLLSSVFAAAVYLAAAVAIDRVDIQYGNRAAFGAALCAAYGSIYCGVFMAARWPAVVFVATAATASAFLHTTVLWRIQDLADGM
jgi:hypothetical protein